MPINRDINLDNIHMDLQGELDIGPTNQQQLNAIGPQNEDERMDGEDGMDIEDNSVQADMGKAGNVAAPKWENWADNTSDKEEGEVSEDSSHEERKTGGDEPGRRGSGS